MAKFGRWGNFTDLARDLKRGIYNLTFKDNMPGEPQTKLWSPSALSPTGGTFTLTAIQPQDSDPSQYQHYAMTGNRCKFYLSTNVAISGTAQSTFWVKLPAPTKSLPNSRHIGRYYDNSSGRWIWVDVLVGYPSEWWIKLVALSETATPGAWPRGTGTLVIEGDYEVHPQWIRNGTYPENSVAFGGSAGSNFVDFSSTVNVTNSGGSAITVNSVYAQQMSLGDFGIYEIYADITLGVTPPTFVIATIPRAVKNFPFTIPFSGNYIEKEYCGTWADFGLANSGPMKVLLKKNSTTIYFVPMNLTTPWNAYAMVGGTRYYLYVEIQAPLEP